MPIGQRDPEVPTAAGPAPKTDLPAAGWTSAVEEQRDRDPLRVGPVDYWGHQTLTAAQLNNGVYVALPTGIVTYQLAVFEAIKVLVGHGVEPRDEPGGYDARHPGSGEMTRQVPSLEVLHLLAPDGDATDSCELYVYAGRFAARVVG